MQDKLRLPCKQVDDTEKMGFMLTATEIICLIFFLRHQIYQNLFFLDVIKADILWKAKVLSEGFDSLLILARVRCHVSSIPTN